jgi:PKD repeat protein
MSNKEKDQFKKRFNVFQIDEAELERMFKQEELRIRAFEVNEAAFQAAMAREAMMQMGYGAGGGASQTTPTAIQFVVNTTDYPEFGFDFTSTGEPIEFTINWGDGTIHEDSGAGGYYEESHTYAEVGEYTVTVTFDDPLKILELNFPGTNDAYDYAGISSITGLQSLANLQDFKADDNYLVSVDLSGLSNLTYVEIGDNFIVGTSTPSLTTVNLSGCTALEELRLDDSDFSGGTPNLTGLNNLKFVDFDESDISGSVDISFLSSLDDFDFSANPGLTELIISSSQPLGLDEQYLNASGCGLTQASVDAILVALSLNGISGATIDLQGGTNAVPGAAGLAAKTVLEENGWEVLINS